MIVVEGYLQHKHNKPEMISTGLNVRRDITTTIDFLAFILKGSSVDLEQTLENFDKNIKLIVIKSYDDDDNKK